MKILAVIETTPQEVKEFLDIIISKTSRKEIDICTCLKIAADNIEEWYANLVPFSGKLLSKPEEMAYAELHQFVHEKEYSPIAQKTQIFIRNTLYEYKNGLFKDIAEQIHNKIGEFSRDVLKEKFTWLSKTEDYEQLIIQRKRINSWLKHLSELTEHLIEYVYPVLKNMGCNQGNSAAYFKTTMGSGSDRDRGSK